MNIVLGGRCQGGGKGRETLREKENQYNQILFQSQRKAMPKNAQTTAQLHSSHASKIILKILQVKLQQYVNCELPDVQAGFRKGRGIRD